ncbi:MAG: CBS domain-containing protein [Methanomassiliicoccus sp.]|nr:CBS domain-containing protein [Methanomassiliicoccus sp.]
MKASLKIGRLLGIPIKIHISFLIILPLFALSFAFARTAILGFTLGYGGLSLDMRWQLVLGFFASILFFIAVLLHELAHSYVALRNGYKISGITLFLFGGVSEIESQPKDAPGEAFMAFVGPATSLAIGVVFLPVWYLLDTQSGLGWEIAAITAGLISFYNLLLGAFNIVPAFPMDGGRVLRAVLAKRLGFIRATTIAVKVGKMIAVAMAILGFIFFNPWLILIALFIYIGAGEEERGTLVAQAMEGLTVGQIMTFPVSTVSPRESIKDLFRRIMAEKHMGYPVVEGERLVGIVTLQDAQKVPSDQQDEVTVDRVMTKEVLTVTPDTPAIEAVQAVSKNRIGRLVVLDQGRIVGIISRSDLLHILQVRAAEKGRDRVKQ